MILDAAHRLFAARGYRETSVDALVSEAGLSKGAFYHHFQSKEALFQALLEDRQRRCIEQMSEAVRPASSPQEAIERLVSASLEFERDDPDWTRLYFEFCAQATRDPFARRIVSNSLKDCRELVAGMLRIGAEGGSVRPELDVDAAALILVGLFDGIALHCTIDSDARGDAGNLAAVTADLIQRFVLTGGDQPLQPMRERTEKFLDEMHRDDKDAP